MVEKRTKQKRDALQLLEAAMDLYNKEDDQKELHFLMVTKTFEVLVEAGWKEFKSQVEDEGMDAPSPKEAIRKAATLGLTKNPEKWIECISARNLSVHNYFRLKPSQFIELVNELIELCKA